MTKAVLDTNIFVAANFNKNSSSAKILEAAQQNKVSIIWNNNTYKETEHILKKIPPVDWERMKKYFKEENEFTKKTNPDYFKKVEDISDRKFIALAEASSSSLISNDDHLLSVNEMYDVDISKPGVFLKDFVLK